MSEAHLSQGVEPARGGEVVQVHDLPIRRPVHLRHFTLGSDVVYGYIYMVHGCIVYESMVYGYMVYASGCAEGGVGDGCDTMGGASDDHYHHHHHWR